MKKTLHNFSEKNLASYQSLQIGNTCAFFAIATSLKLLLNYQVDPIALAFEVDQLWRRGRFLRLWPGWAVAPRMLARMVRHIAKTRTLPIDAHFQRGKIETLRNFLDDPGSIPIVTLTWLWGKVPPIYLGTTSKNYNTLPGPGGHTMILAAFNPDHRSGSDVITPWGFINPWKMNVSHLFWMTDHDFRESWLNWLPFKGRNPLVIVTKMPSIK